MQSHVCTIENGTKDLEAIFTECEKVAEYNGLTQKQALQLRLICEEIDGMLPKITDDFNGKLWIDFEFGVCKVNVSVNIPMLTANQKGELIAISNDKKNASAVGIVGRIRNAIEDYLLNEEQYVNCHNGSSNVFMPSTGFSEGVDYSYLWSLEQYRVSVEKENQPEAWDELEKSIIASVADNVIVGIKGRQADITIVKKFA